MGQYEAAKVICDAIKTAEIIFRDEIGNKLFTAYVGTFSPERQSSTKSRDQQTCPSSSSDKSITSLGRQS